VSYSSSNQNPTNYSVDPSRTISWVVNDGTTSSATQTTTINITGGPATNSLFSPSATPGTVTENDPSAVDLGVKFQATTNATIVGTRIYSAPQNTGTHIGDLWTTSGTLLASATFSNETASGWQQVNFSTPVSITAGTTYIASYETSVGEYSEDDNYFTNSLTNGPLTAPSSSASGGNGVYAYGSSNPFPNNTFNAANYWVDVIYQPTSISVIIAGTAQEGQTLTANPSGAVTGYQWQSFIGGTWTNISGATSSTYVVQEADEGHQLRVHVTSSGGSADSAATSAVIDISPTLATPVISGTAREGQTLTATAAVANDSDATVSYQWQANHGSGFVNIAGATNLSYVVQEADEGGTLRIVATSTDTDGSGTSATSTATSAVIDISPTLTTPVISGTAQQGQNLTATAAVADSRDATVSYQWGANNGCGVATSAW